MRFLLVLSLLIAGVLPAVAQGDIERQRQEGMQQYRDAGVPNPTAIRETAAILFAKPLAEQDEGELRIIARAANAYANYIDMIHSQYNRYRVDNLRLNFILQRLEPVQDAYAVLSNEFKAIRNRAYLNLGEKAEAAGDALQALYYYNDAYRLSAFSCFGMGVDRPCSRFEAERRMQRILRIDSIQPFQ